MSIIPKTVTISKKIVFAICCLYAVGFYDTKAINFEIDYPKMSKELKDIKKSKNEKMSSIKFFYLLQENVLAHNNFVISYHGVDRILGVLSESVFDQSSIDHMRLEKFRNSMLKKHSYPDQAINFINTSTAVFPRYYIGDNEVNKLEQQNYIVHDNIIELDGVTENKLSAKLEPSINKQIYSMDDQNKKYFRNFFISEF